MVERESRRTRRGAEENLKYEDAMPWRVRRVDRSSSGLNRIGMFSRRRDTRADGSRGGRSSRTRGGRSWLADSGVVRRPLVRSRMQSHRMDRPSSSTGSDHGATIHVFFLLGATTRTLAVAVEQIVLMSIGASPCTFKKCAGTLVGSRLRALSYKAMPLQQGGLRHITCTPLAVRAKA